MNTGHSFSPFLPVRALTLTLLAVLLACLCAVQARTQQGRENQKSADDAVKLKAHLVNIDVMVKDKKGRYVTDLEPDDFTITENGAPQKLEFFDPPLATSNETGQPSVARSKSVPSTGKPTSIISLLLDGGTTELANMKQVREGTLKYIRERIADTDTVAVFGVSNELRLLQPFTQDKAKLISAVDQAYTLTASNKNLESAGNAEQIARLREELSGSPGTSPGQSPSGGSAAARAMIAARVLDQYLLLRAQLSVQQARPVLAALAAICEAQRAIPGKKTLVLFSQGFVTPAILDWQVQSVIDIANRANVAIYIIDSAGLTASGPKSGAFVAPSQLEGIAATGSPESRSRAVGGDSVFDNARQEGLNRQYDILYQISGDTGGEFFKGSNDISKGLDRIDQQIHARYTLAYYSTDPNFDGNFRKVKVEVRRPDAHVTSRSGYYAIASEDIVPLSVDERKLLANLAGAEANPALPLFMELTPFRSQEGRYIVPLSIEVPPGAVKFEQKGDKQQMHLDVLGVIRESQDKILSRLGGSFNVGLAAEQFKLVQNNNIFYRQDVELAPGTYSVELIVKDRLSGKMAARREKLVLPAADAQFSSSGVVLSRIAMPVKNQAGASPSEDVLSHGGVKIRPSPGRVFRPADNLIIFFELYNAAPSAETGKPLVRVSVRLMKDDKAAMRPIDYVLTEALTEPVPHLTFSKYISLNGLAAGKYTAIIEARDMVTRKPVTQQASFVIEQ